jgi:(E)-4-hydroxy-3-methylbut-2-enyl-diphosphate synthase
VEEYCKTINKQITVAVMGCAVNGPGEAKSADIGIAGGRGQGIIFKKGVILRSVSEEELIPELIKEIQKL